MLLSRVLGAQSRFERLGPHLRITAHLHSKYTSPPSLALRIGGHVQNWLGCASNDVAQSIRRRRSVRRRSTRTWSGRIGCKGLGDCTYLLVSIDTSIARYGGKPGMSNLIFFRRQGSHAKVGRRRRLDVTEISFAIAITEAKLSWCRRCA
jgi:hypothetical protein